MTGAPANWKILAAIVALLAALVLWVTAPRAENPNDRIISKPMSLAGLQAAGEILARNGCLPERFPLKEGAYYTTYRLKRQFSYIAMVLAYDRIEQEYCHFFLVVYKAHLWGVAKLPLYGINQWGFIFPEAGKIKIWC